jgi:hypothetical protein
MLAAKRRAVIAEALQELTIEHQRLLEQERRAVRDSADEHLKAAEALLASGQLPDAWSRACDAVQLDPSYEAAIALEARLRRTLDDQAGPVRREQRVFPDSGRAEAPGEPAIKPRVEINATAPAPETSRTWVVAVMLTIAALLIALAARAC